MPAYIANPQPCQVKCLYPGGRIVLAAPGETFAANANTIQFAVPRLAGGEAPQVNLFNPAGAQLSLYAAPYDVDSEYVWAASVLNPSNQVAAPWQWMRAQFASAATMADGEYIIATM